MCLVCLSMCDLGYLWIIKEKSALSMKGKSMSTCSSLICMYHVLCNTFLYGVLAVDLLVENVWDFM